MTHPFAHVLTMLSPRQPPRGPGTSDLASRWSRTRRWTAALAVAVATVSTTTEAAPVAAQANPATCEPLPPFAGDKAALMAAGEALVARARQLAHGSAEHTDVKIEIMALFARAGDLEMCKLLRQTRETSSLSAKQTHAIACVQQQFCRPMPLAKGCPAGMANQGPEGCAPIRSCTAAAQATACKTGDTSCCAPALLGLEIADAEAGMPTPQSLATRRALAKTACDAGHAEVCLEAAALGVGTLESQRKRACSLGHVESCRPANSAP
ncbi:hypothetical protein [Nannocystis pusilla]|uniref:Sel1 repeat family protein n=1 Tax=Nannocystis pusilla TaxID=889268 RepID=A0ABS7TID8_9BACT|nr:hypothetical protein [Nannocystis pusilla]MBZ5707882.1 hypothetical protein [Nannocystis pusilla]